MAVDWTKANQAYKLAQDVHKGQKRDGGLDYITHPVAIATAIRGVDAYAEDADLQVVALLHDAIEDTTGDPDVLRRDIVDMFGTDILRSLVYLTKAPGMDYAAYIKRLIDSKDRMALIVKKHDLAHNLTDHKLGARRDKYMLAQILVDQALDRIGE